MSPDPLAELRGYHLPDPVVWWPPAPGWWALAVLLSLLTLLGVHWFLVRRRRCEAARRALAEIRALKAGFVREPDAAAAARALSQLLRRFAIARFGVRQAAGLTGDDWLGLLDAHGGRDGAA